MNLPSLPKLRIVTEHTSSLLKYILYTEENKAVKVHYAYHLFILSPNTVLHVFKDGVFEQSLSLDMQVEFNPKNPLSSIRKFYQLLILQD